MGDGPGRPQNSRPLSLSTVFTRTRCSSKNGNTSLFITCTAVSGSLLV